MRPDELLELQKTTAAIIVKAGKMVLDSWHSIRETDLKDNRDVVTNVDREVEDFIKENLELALPSSSFEGEERGSSAGSEFVWYIDPIDGTKDYAAQSPIFVTQIALVHNGKPLLGHVYNPLAEDLFSASAGNGVYHNEESFSPKLRDNLSDAIISMDFGGASESLERKAAVFSKVAASCYRIRMVSPFACYMLTGAYDVYVGFKENIKDVDSYPRRILFEEAGFTYNIELINDMEVIIATTDKLYSQLMPLLL